MNTGWTWTLLVAGALGVSISAGLAQEKQPPPKPKLVVEPAKQIDSVEGQKLFAAYCASCHGKEGKGNGPAAVALKMPPPDLTLLAKKNGGTFANLQIEQMISGRGRQVASHGSSEMPIWGDVFYAMGKDQALQTLRIKNLVSYLEQMQAK